MTSEEREVEIREALDGIHGWKFVVREIDNRIADLTEQLVNNDNEQTRGRIKALREVKELPETLRFEWEGISAALANQAAAN